MGTVYYYARKEKMLIGNSNADICIYGLEKEYLVTENEVYIRNRDGSDIMNRKLEIGEGENM